MSSDAMNAPIAEAILDARNEPTLPQSRIALGLEALGATIFDFDIQSGAFVGSGVVRKQLLYDEADISHTISWWISKIHPVDFARSERIFRSEIVQRTPRICLNFRVRRKDGAWLYLEVLGLTTYNADGTLKNVTGSIVDISPRIAMIEAQARLASILDNSSDAIICIGLDARILSWNFGAEKLYDYRAHDVIGQLATILAQGDNKSHISDHLQDAFVGVVKTYETRLNKSNGEEVAVSISLAPLRDDNGAIIGVSAIHRDISSRLEVKAVNAELATIVSASTDAIISASAQNIITSWNDGAENLLGWTAAEMIGRSATVLIPMERQDEHAYIKGKLAEGAPWMGETEWLAKNGEKIAIWASISPVMDSGKLMGLAAILRDQRERNARTTHIENMLRELSHRSKNLLAIVLSIARQTGSYSQDYEAFQKSFTARIIGLAKSHDLLVLHNWHGVDLQSLIWAQLSALPEINPDLVAIKGPAANLTPEAAQNIGMAIHELATNAIKFGAFSSRNGALTISWRLIGESSENFEMCWKESGYELPQDHDARRGFGRMVVTKLAPKALNGSAKLEYSLNSFCWTLTAPADCVIVN